MLGQYASPEDVGRSIATYKDAVEASGRRFDPMQVGGTRAFFVTDSRAEKETERLQTEATEALERHLEELQPELAKVVNKVTRDALKQKAKQLGTVKEIAEDAETGSLTIKVEV